MAKGKVKYFNESKGYGFIKENGIEKDHFVHKTGVIGTIREGDEVEFELRQGQKGINAVDVKVI